MLSPGEVQLPLALPVCSATTKAGKPCRNRPVRGSDPPLCVSHGGAKGRVGARMGNRSALKHGVYSRREDPDPSQESGQALRDKDDAQAGHPDLPGRIRDLDHKIQQLATYIDGQQGLEADDMATLYKLYGELVSRLGRLMRDQQALDGATGGGISEAIDQALDELSVILETEL